MPVGWGAAQVRHCKRFARLLVLIVLAGVRMTSLTVDAAPATRGIDHTSCEAMTSVGRLAWCEPDEDIVFPPDAESSLRGTTSLNNPAFGQLLVGTADDPVAAFSRRPFDNFIFPEGGLYLDPLHDGPHYGLDYANADDHNQGKDTYFYPIGPGYVTARSTCVACYAEGDAAGQVVTKWPRYNFGWGNLVLVETPYTPNVSIYVLYAHLARDFVSLGDYVTPDEVLGVVGNTGYSQGYHVHVEVRFGAPGQFWNADFTEWATLDRWMATMFTNPAYLILPDSHPAFLTAIHEWLALQPPPIDIP